jgi:hypothetical protein
MSRTTRRMIERLEPFAEPPKKASTAPDAKPRNDADTKNGKPGEPLPIPQRSKPRVK